MSVGRWIVVLGLIVAGTGLLIMAAEKSSFLRPGRLPGDFVYRGKHVTFYFPIGICVLLSLLLTLLFSFFRKR